MLRNFARLASQCLAFGVLSLAAGMPSTAEAGKFVFPYNHNDLKWLSIEGEHFVVHYPVSKVSREEGNEHYLSAEWAARKVAKVADEMWEPMCREFNYYLKEKIHIVLLEQTDELEGFTIPSWDWIAISANPGSWFYRERGHMEWFSDVLVHEFAHVVSLKANGWTAEGSQGVLVGGLYQDGIRNTGTGGEIFIGDSDSVFWTEGGAEFWSDNTGYNTWTSKRDMVLRTTVLEDRLLTYDEWHDRAGKGNWWRDPERYYQQGYSFGQYLRQRFGDTVYAEFAVRGGQQGWRLSWESVIKDVTGYDAETLYNDWVVYAKETYGAQADAIRARGEVAGRELNNLKAADWEYTDPDGRDKWMKKKWYEREKAREKTGRYTFYPRMNQDGTLLGVNSGFGLGISALDERSYPAFSGHPARDPGSAENNSLLSTGAPLNFGDAWDFIPGKDAVVVSGTEHMIPKFGEWLTGIRLETDGYDFKQLWYYELPVEEVETKQGDTVRTRLGRSMGKKALLPEKGTYRPIPNTLRGTDPAVSPDGARVAYFEYADGSMNLVTINLDGSDKKYLTNFKDGSWLQQVDWSPDGKKLVFAIMRNYQKNLYLINADGSGLAPINMDGWEDQDPYWANDGKIYFSSDPGGVFNIYSYEVETGAFRQVTNVIGGAECPVITPDGNLLYVYYSSYGWKFYGLAGDAFMNASADHLFETDFTPAQAAADLAFSEDLSTFESVEYKAKPSNYMAPTAVPMFRVENDSQTNLGLQAGVQVFAQDYVEKNGLFLYTLLGEDNLFLAQYFNNMLPTTITATAYHYEVKTTSGYLLDEDEDPSTTEDQTSWEVRNAQYANIAALNLDYTWNGKFTTYAFSRYLDYGFKGTGDGAFVPYLREAEVGFEAIFSTAGAAAYRPNTFTGRTIDLIYNHAWTDIVYEPYGGVAVDDGMELDNYQYNKIELRWTENIRMPALFGIPLLKKAKDHNHVIQIDGQVGYIDRNVDVNDEFNAGGQHPYFWGSGTLRPNTQFAGYPPYSLSGETMAILNLAYRFPINQYIAKKAGPFFIHGIFAQVGGTAGNLWSYQLQEGVPSKGALFGDSVAIDPADVHREIPFVDKAYKNGNVLLTDLSAELRVQATIFHGMPWDSFVRVAYGFQEVGGTGDVNGDGIFDTSENAIADTLSNETEKPGPRVYLGFGTGW